MHASVAQFHGTFTVSFHSHLIILSFVLIKIVVWNSVKELGSCADRMKTKSQATFTPFYCYDWCICLCNAWYFLPSTGIRWFLIHTLWKLRCTREFCFIKCYLPSFQDWKIFVISIHQDTLYINHDLSLLSKHLLRLQFEFWFLLATLVHIQHNQTLERGWKRPPASYYWVRSYLCCRV